MYYRLVTPLLDVFAETGGAFRALTRSWIATADRFGEVTFVLNMGSGEGQQWPILSGLEVIDPYAAAGAAK